MVSLEPRGDDHGFVARFFCVEKFAGHGLEACFVQLNNSVSTHAHTLRGLHYQIAPAVKVKPVCCIAKRASDAVEMRTGPPGSGRWAGAELMAGNRRMRHMPTGCGHGFLTLDGNTEMLYLARPARSRIRRILRITATCSGAQ